MESLSAYAAKHDQCRKQLSEYGSCQDELLIYSIDRKMPDGTPGPVGGFADRLKGVLFTYVIARLTGRMFFIDWEAPAPLSSVFSPVAFNWGLPLNKADLNPKRLDWVDKNFIKKAETPLLEGNLKRVDELLGSGASVINCNLMRYDIIEQYAKANASLEIDLSRAPAIFSSLFNQLFSYEASPEVSKNHEAFRQFKSRFGALIGVQFRTGGGGAWKDPTLDSIENIGALAQAVDHVRHSNDMSSVGAYITTDTQEAKSKISEQLESLGLESMYFEDEPTHLDRSDSEVAKRNFHQLVLEHSLLGQCNEVVVGKGAFGVTAAFRSNKQPLRYFNIK